MKISIVAIAHKGIIDEVLAFENAKEAEKEYHKLAREFNRFEDNIQLFDDIEIKWLLPSLTEGASRNKFQAV